VLKRRAVSMNQARSDGALPRGIERARPDIARKTSRLKAARWRAWARDVESGPLNMDPPPGGRS